MGQPSMSQRAWSHALAQHLGASKRAPDVLWTAGYGGDYGEPPPRSAVIPPVSYATSEQVNASVTAFANRGTTAPLRLYKPVADADGEQVFNHQILDLLSNPNPFLTRFELFWHVIGDLLLSGNSYWFLAGPNNGAPTEIWRMNPRKIRIVRSELDYIVGYILENEEGPVALEEAEVIHYRLPNPDDPFYGLSRVAAAMRAARTGIAMADWNQNFFSQDNAIPAGIVKFEDNVDNNTFAQAKKDWRETYGGTSRRTAFLRGGKMQYETTGLSQKETDFIVGAKWQAEQVNRVFGTLHLLPSVGANDSKVNERIFLEEYAWPMLIYIAEVLSDRLASFFGPEGSLYFQFDDIRPRERALDLEERREQEKKQTVNEARIADKLEPKDGGDDVMFVHMVSGTLLKFEQDALPDEPEPSQQLVEDDEPDPAPDDDDESDADRPQTADENAEDRESAGDDVGDDIGGSTDRAVGLRPSRKEDQQLETADQRNGELYSVLYLSDIGQLGSLQDKLKQSDFELVPHDELHVTMVYAEDVMQFDLEWIINQFDIINFAPISLEGHQMEWFGDDPGRQALVLKVEGEGLHELQAKVYAAFTSAYGSISTYSEPDRWQPHITLGYGKSFATHEVMPISVVADKLSLSQDDYQDILIIDAQGKSITAIQLDDALSELAQFKRFSLAQVGKSTTRQFSFDVLPGYFYTEARELLEGLTDPVQIKLAFIILRDMAQDDFTLPPVRSYALTQNNYEFMLAVLVEGAFTHSVSSRNFLLRGKQAISISFEAAFFDGMEDAGVIVNELSQEERAEVSLEVSAEHGYWLSMRNQLYKEVLPDLEGAALIEQKKRFENRMNNWITKGLRRMYELGKLSAKRNQMMIWVRGATSDGCRTCVTADGQIHRAKTWKQKGIVPRTDSLICGGFRCDCGVFDTTGKARGRIDRIPLV